MVSTECQTSFTSEGGVQASSSADASTQHDNEEVSQGGRGTDHGRQLQGDDTEDDVMHLKAQLQMERRNASENRTALTELYERQVVATLEGDMLLEELRHFCGGFGIPETEADGN